MKKIIIPISLIFVLSFTGCSLFSSGSDSSISPVLAAGSRHSLVLKPDGSVYAFGNNEYGQLGNGRAGNDDGEDEDKATPILIMTDAKYVSAGAYFSYILKNDGSLYGFGANIYGQLGIGSAGDGEYEIEPVFIMDEVSKVEGDGSEYHCLILKNNGDLYATGNNEDGQLGDGTTVDKSLPVYIMSDVKDMAGGFNFSLVLKNNGTVYFWGSESYQISGGAVILSPKQIMTDVAKISTGWFHCMVLKTDGSLYTFGGNNRGQLGNGTLEDVSDPYHFMDDIVDISAGAYHSLFLKTNGVLYGVGYNTYGQLGTGETNDEQMTTVEIMADVASFAGGGGHTMFLKTDGTFYAVGLNTDGQLGIGTFENVSTPIEVSF